MPIWGKNLETVEGNFREDRKSEESEKTILANANRVTMQPTLQTIYTS